jgi:hypothetical protein
VLGTGAAEKTRTSNTRNARYPQRGGRPASRRAPRVLAGTGSPSEGTGLDASAGVLFVLDGAKALHAAVRSVFDGDPIAANGVAATRARASSVTCPPRRRPSRRLIAPGSATVAR